MKNKDLIVFFVVLLLFSQNAFAKEKPIPTTDYATWNFTADGFYSWLEEPDLSKSLKKYGWNEALNETQFQEIVAEGERLREIGVVVPEFKTWRLDTAKMSADLFGKDISGYEYSISHPEPYALRYGKILVIPLSEKQREAAERDVESWEFFQYLVNDPSCEMTPVADPGKQVQSMYMGLKSSGEWFAIALLDGNLIFFRLTGFSDDIASGSYSMVKNMIEDLSSMELVFPKPQKTVGIFWVLGAACTGLFIGMGIAIPTTVLLLRRRKKAKALAGAVPTASAEVSEPPDLTAQEPPAPPASDAEDPPIDSQ